MGNYTLYIAEKPEVAAAIAAQLNGGNKPKRDKYYWELPDCRVTWCRGHLRESKDFKEYDAKWENWVLDDLPFAITPDKFETRVKESANDLHEAVSKLLVGTSRVIHAGDPDAEGQLLVDEVLNACGFKGTVDRVLINDLTPAVLAKSLAKPRSNAEFKGLSDGALARQIADWLYGFNLTRAYTIAARKQGRSNGNGVLAVGRVKTPILGLVVRRYRENTSHQAANYYVITGNFNINGIEFTGTYVPKPSDSVDEKGRLLDKAAATATADAAKQQPATIISAETVDKFTPPPLPYNLLKLQATAARMYGYRPDAVMDITQTLREKYHLITYNRSDCQYLSEEQHADAPAVLEAILKNDPDLGELVKGTNTKLKSRAFDSSKITAHHAIIPTQSTTDINNLSDAERRIYELIAKAYILQFYPNYQYKQTSVKVACADAEWKSTGSAPVVPGWKAVGGEEAAEDDDKSDDNDESAAPGEKLQQLKKDNNGTCTSAKAEEKATKPRPLYTMATLLTDLTRVAQYVQDANIRKLLIEKDKGKAGEHGGIGTPATRSGLIKDLFTNDFIREEKKGKTQVIVPSDKGLEFYDSLPDIAKFPDMTALWYEQIAKIEKGDMTLDEYIAEINAFIADQVDAVKNGKIHLNFTPEAVCPECGKPMGRRYTLRDGKKEYFWGCTGYPDCKVTLPDDKGKPGKYKPKAVVDDNVKCPECGKPMARKMTEKNGKKEYFWSCTGYPTCKTTLPDDNGKPGQRKPRAVIPADAPKCNKCGKPMVLRTSAHGPFWGCTGYPNCKNAVPDKDGKPDFDAKKDGKKEK